MIKKTSSNQPCERDSEYIIGAFLKSFSIYKVNGEEESKSIICAMVGYKNPSL